MTSPFIQPLLLVTCLCIPLLYVALLPYDSLTSLPVGIALICSSIAYGASLISSRRIRREQLAPIAAACILSAVYILSSVNANNLDTDALKTITQIFLVLTFFYVVQSRMSLHDSHTERVLPIITLLFFLPLIAMLIYIARGLGNDDPDSFWTRAKNCVGALSLALTILNFGIQKMRCAAGKKPTASFLAAVGSLACLIACGSRGSQLAISVTVITYLVWDKARPKVLLLIGVLIFIPCFIYIYMNLQELANISLIEDRVRSFTGANLYSGRQLIWPSIIAAVQNNSPILGLGANAHASAVMAADGIIRDWSAHSLYLQVYLQGGAAGCVALIIFIVCVWRELFRSPISNFHKRIACSAFLGFLVYDLFEVSLLQNSLSTGIVLWLALGLLSSTTARASERT